jgi:hypothetical protein
MHLYQFISVQKIDNSINLLNNIASLNLELAFLLFRTTIINSEIILFLLRLKLLVNIVHKIYGKTWPSRGGYACFNTSESLVFKQRVRILPIEYTLLF